MAQLKDFIEKQKDTKLEVTTEQDLNKSKSARTNQIVKTFASDRPAQKQRISATVDPVKWQIFGKINKVRGISSNAALNVMISEYILDYENLLDD